MPLPKPKNIPAPKTYDPHYSYDTAGHDRYNCTIKECPKCSTRRQTTTVGPMRNPTKEETLEEMLERLNIKFKIDFTKVVDEIKKKGEK